MPAGEFIAEVVLRSILELFLYGITYWVGYLFLKMITLGSIRLAPLTTITEKNRTKKRWNQIDWSIWLHQPLQGRALKAEFVCCVGFLIGIATGLLIYFGTR